MSGKIVIKIAISDSEILQNFCVVDISEKSVLGLAFLYKQSYHLDIVNEFTILKNVRNHSYT